MNMHLQLSYTIWCVTLMFVARTAFGGKLYTPEYTYLTAVEGRREYINISCEGQMMANDFMVLQKQGSTAALANAVSLDAVTISIVSELRDYVWSAIGSISTTNPPYVNVTISYSLSAANRSHAGAYKCELGNTVANWNMDVEGPPYRVELMEGDSTNGLRLKKLPLFDLNLYPLSREMYQAKVDIDATGNVELMADGYGLPMPALTWYQKIDGKLEWISQNAGHDELMLERNMQDLDGAEYLVSAVNRHGSYNISVLTVVEYKPRSPAYLDGETDIYPMVGETLVRGCIFDGKPKPTIFYAKEDMNTMEWYRLPNTEDDLLKLDNVELENDLGRYKCVAENSYGTASGYIYVHGKPKEVSVTIVNIYSTSVDIVLKSRCATAVDFNITYESFDEGGLVKRTVSNTVAGTSDKLPSIVKHHMLAKLTPGTEYNLTVSAINIFGEAVAVGKQFTTMEAGYTRPPTDAAIAQVTTQVKDDGPTDSAAHLLANVCMVLSGLILYLQL